MNGKINGYDWLNAKPMLYWSFTASTPIEKRRDTIRNAIFGGEYLGALKVDGYYERLLKDEDGNCYLIARNRNVNGEIVNKIEWLPQINSWLATIPNGTCFLCECYQPGNEGSKNITSILGCLKDKAIFRQKNNPLHLYIFDVMAYNGVNFNKTKYEDRAKMVESLESQHPSEFVSYAHFYEGEDLWNKISEYLNSGREGVVIMRKDAIVYDKRTPARISIKIKKEIQQTIDCFFTGRGTAPTKAYTGKEIETWRYWVNSITDERMEGEFFDKYLKGEPIMPVTKPYFYKWAGSLEIGVTVPRGDGTNDIRPIGYLSGVPDEYKANFKDYAMVPIEVSCMEIFYSDGKFSGLRHPKLIGLRPDLKPSDCSFDKIV